MTWAAGYAGALYAPLGVTGSLLLDSIATTVKGAYSLRRLRTAYAGSSLRVRRSSDGTEQDIGFDGAGSLDIAALLAFCGPGDGFLSKWYDQAGAAQDLVQTAAANQPKLVLAGAVNVLGAAARPAPKFSAANQNYLQAPSFAMGGTAYAVASVVSRTASIAANARMLTFYASGTNDYSAASNVIFAYLTSGVLRGYQTGDKSGVALGTAPAQAASVWNGASHTMTLDGVAGSAVAAAGTLVATGFLRIGAGSAPADAWDGQHAEHLVISGGHRQLVVDGIAEGAIG